MIPTTNPDESELPLGDEIEPTVSEALPLRQRRACRRPLNVAWLQLSSDENAFAEGLERINEETDCTASEKQNDSRTEANGGADGRLLKSDSPGTLPVCLGLSISAFYGQLISSIYYKLYLTKCFSLSLKHNSTVLLKVYEYLPHTGKYIQAFNYYQACTDGRPVYLSEFLIY